MTKISFTIPGEPRAKGRPRTRVVGKSARIYTDPVDLKAEGVIRGIAGAALCGAPRITGAVRLSLIAIFEPPKSWNKTRHAQAMSGYLLHTSRPDLDNIEKLVLDGCNPLRVKVGDEIERHGGIWDDDSQVAEVFKRKRYGSPARVEITVEVLDDTGGLL